MRRFLSATVYAAVGLVILTSPAIFLLCVLVRYVRTVHNMALPPSQDPRR